MVYSVPEQSNKSHFFDVHPSKYKLWRSSSEGPPDIFNPYGHIACFQELEGRKDPKTTISLLATSQEFTGVALFAIRNTYMLSLGLKRWLSS